MECPYCNSHNKNNQDNECISYNIDKYLEAFNNIDLINQEIELLEKVYEQIIILNYQIANTSGFDNMYIIKYLDNKITKINEQLKIERSKHFQNINHTNIQQLEQEKRELTSKLLEVNGHRSFDSINMMYRIYFKNDNIFIESENTYIIKIYKLHIFNLEKQKELKELLDIHTSQNLIKMKLTGLYENKIDILKN
jgi:hypothetical protein